MRISSSRIVYLVMVCNKYAPNANVYNELFHSRHSYRHYSILVLQALYFHVTIQKWLLFIMRNYWMQFSFPETLTNSTLLLDQAQLWVHHYSILHSDLGIITGWRLVTTHTLGARNSWLCEGKAKQIPQMFVFNLGTRVPSSVLQPQLKIILRPHSPAPYVSGWCHLANSERKEVHICSLKRLNKVL